jgi:hypothetical protein
MKAFVIKLPALILAVSLITALMASCDRGKDSGDQALSGDLVTNPASTGGEARMAKIVFTHTKHDFGTIKEGEIVFWNFRFKNDGKADLILNRVKADCGCTVPDYPTTPIAPGEEGKIRVTFNSKGREGHQIKNVTVLSNSEHPTMVLTITAMVER